MGRNEKILGSLVYESSYRYRYFRAIGDVSLAPFFIGRERAKNSNSQTQATAPVDLFQWRRRGEGRCQTQTTASGRANGVDIRSGEPGLGLPLPCACKTAQPTYECAHALQCVEAWKNKKSDITCASTPWFDASLGTCLSRLCQARCGPCNNCVNIPWCSPTLVCSSYLWVSFHTSKSRREKETHLCCTGLRAVAARQEGRPFPRSECGHTAKEGRGRRDGTSI